MSENTAARRTGTGSLAVRLTTPLLLLLLCAGAALLTYSLLPSHYIQRYLNLAFMDSLKTTSTTAGLNIVEKEIPTDNTGRPVYDKGRISYPKFGEKYAVLEAKSIGLTVGVYYGVNSELLARGVCQSTQSPCFGDGGNTVIDGHVNTFFADLGKLKVGDELVLQTEYGRFVYTVSELISFDKDDKRYVTATKTECLTVYTCQPQVLGSSDMRVGVRCVPKTMQYYDPLTD